MFRFISSLCVRLCSFLLFHFFPLLTSPPRLLARPRLNYPAPAPNGTNDAIDAAETAVPDQGLVPKTVEKEEWEKMSMEEEVDPAKVEKPGPEGLTESSGEKADEVGEAESMPEDVPPVETPKEAAVTKEDEAESGNLVAAAEDEAEAVSEANDTAVETIPEVNPEAEVVVPEAEPAALETATEVSQEVESDNEEVTEVAAENTSDEESASTAIEAVPEEPAKEEPPAEAVEEQSTKIEEPKEVSEAENEKPIEIPTVDEEEEEEAQETVTQAVTEAATAEEAIEDKAAAAAAAAEEEDDDDDDEEEGASPQEKKQSRNVISRMRRSFSKVRKAFVGKPPGAKTADANSEGKAK